MDYYYLQKSDNEKVWLPKSKAKNRNEFVYEKGSYHFFGQDGEPYFVDEVYATNIFYLNGWAAPLVAIICGGLVFPYSWFWAYVALLYGYTITDIICNYINLDVEYFNNSHFQIP